jgi:hypothetical protein
MCFIVLLRKLHAKHAFWEQNTVGGPAERVNLPNRINSPTGGRGQGESLSADKEPQIIISSW